MTSTSVYGGQNPTAFQAPMQAAPAGFAQQSGPVAGMNPGTAQNLMPIIEELLQIVVQLLGALTGGEGTGGFGGIPGQGAGGTPGSPAGMPGGDPCGCHPLVPRCGNPFGMPPSDPTPAPCSNGDTSPNSGTPSTSPRPIPTTPVSGSFVGDPHYDVNGKHFDFQGKAGKTYNEIYDPSTGLTVNTTFRQFGGNKSHVRTVSAEGFSFDGNQLEVKAGSKGEVADLNGKQLKDGSYDNGEVVVQKGQVQVKADNFDFIVSDGGGYLNTSFKGDLTAQQQAGLTGIVGSPIANPNAPADPSTLGQYQVPALFGHSGTGGTRGGTGGNGGTPGDTSLITGLLQDATSLLQIATQLETNSGNSNPTLV